MSMTSRVRQVANHPERADPWLADLLQRKPARLATVAMVSTEPLCATGTSAMASARLMWAMLAATNLTDCALPECKKKPETARPTM